MSGNVLISAFTDEQAERLTGVSRSQLRYWERTHFYSPSHGSKLYSFRDLVCLKVLNTLRNDVKVSLQHLRDVKDVLLHLGDDLWAKTTLYILAKRVVIQNPETEELEDAVNKQGVLQIPLRVVSDNMAQAIETLNVRDKANPQIVKSRGVAGNQFVIEGTRIPVENVKDFAEAGYSIKAIMAEYPSLSRKEIAAAIKFDPAA